MLPRSGHGPATVVFGTGEEWWVAGLAGAIVGAVWNYAVSSVYTCERLGGREYGKGQFWLD